MLSRFAGQTLLLGSGLVLAGILTANLALIALAAGPFAALVLASFASAPRVAEASVDVERRTSYVGQVVRVRATAKLAGAWGPLDLRVRLPPPFEVVEGSNFRHVWVGPGQEGVSLDFTVRCTKRGVQAIGPIEFESVHPTLLGGARRGAAGEPRALRVRPRWSRLRRVRTLRAKGRTVAPEIDRSQTGPTTTEFDDLRAYHWGDSPRSINWKASARRGEMAGQPVLLVNEYEREGRKLVWIFLDANRTQMVGTSLDNAFERRVEAAFAAATFFLKRGYALGATVFNGESLRMLAPESGSTQRVKLSELLTQLTPSEPKTSLLRAVEAAKPHLRARKTLVIVLTSVAADHADLEAGLRALRNRVGHRRGRVPVLLVHTNPYGLVPDPDESALARTTSLLQRPHVAALQRLGVRTVTWDPSRVALGGLLRRMVP